MLDQEVLGVQQGYWAGYYSGYSKHKKSVKQIVDSIVRSHKTSTKSQARPDVDVSMFLAREQAFKQKQEGRYPHG